MNEGFDPYHKWLGIPPEEQPAHHYRLLGIGLFENDRDVISNAADARMTQLRAYQQGQRAAEAVELLNAVSAARVCLLSAERRAAYDEQLRGASDRRQSDFVEPPPLPPVEVAAIPVAVPVTIPVAEAVPPSESNGFEQPEVETPQVETPRNELHEADPESEIPGLRSTAWRYRPRRKQPPLEMQLAAVATVLLLIGLGAFLLLAGPGQTVPSGPAPSPVVPRERFRPPATLPRAPDTTSRPSIDIEPKDDREVRPAQPPQHPTPLERPPAAEEEESGDVDAIILG